MSENSNDNCKNTSIKSTMRIELHYLPAISYFKQIAAADKLVLEAHETFQKQTFRNRCELLTANGRESLIVPIEHAGNHQLIKDVKIDYSQRWPQIHERSIRSAYGKSPFFDFFIDGFAAVWAKKHLYLWDLNFEMLTVCLEKLRIKKEITESNSFDFSQNELSDNIIDLRHTIIPNQYSFYRQNGIKAYQQVFGNEFVRDLSILDLLFCAALDSSALLH